MLLNDHIQDIQRRLNKGEYRTEKQVSENIVKRLLNVLDWMHYDEDRVLTEYQVKNGRVDYALCAKPKKPVVFIEVKKPGKIRGADSQVFRYAFHKGVPLAVVTDGCEWCFYLPAGMGDYEERKFCVLDLAENDAADAAECLHKYLLFEDVANGNAFQSAQDDYQKAIAERESVSQIPLAWTKLLEEKNAGLITAVSEKVAVLCGHAPPKERVIQYLSSLTPKIECASPGVRGQNAQQKASPTMLKVTFPDNEVICQDTAADTLIESLRKVGFEKAANLGIKKGEHPIISMQQHNPGWKDTQSGFFVHTVSSTKGKERLLKKIASQLNLNLRIETINKIN